MIWVGLTGGIASGKSTAASFLRQWGYPVIDADEIAKSVVSPGTIGLQKIVLAFGPQILGPDQGLDRKKIAQLVFSQPHDLKKLEAIIHPLVRQVVAEKRQIEEKRGNEIAFYDVPLLFEKNLQAEFDCIVLVSCSERNQKARMKERDSFSEAEIQARLKNQIPLEKKELQADFVIRNDGTLKDLEKSLKSVCEKIKTRS